MPYSYTCPNHPARPTPLTQPPSTYTHAQVLRPLPVQVEGLPHGQRHRTHLLPLVPPRAARQGRGEGPAALPGGHRAVRSYSYRMPRPRPFLPFPYLPTHPHHTIPRNRTHTGTRPTRGCFRPGRSSSPATAPWRRRAASSRRPWSTTSRSSPCSNGSCGAPSPSPPTPPRPPPHKS